MVKYTKGNTYTSLKLKGLATMGSITVKFNSYFPGNVGEKMIYRERTGKMKKVILVTTVPHSYKHLSMREPDVLNPLQTQDLAETNYESIYKSQIYC